MQNLSGKVIRGYELREQVGEGGFGTVYRAFQPAVGREVAIKVIIPEHANQPDFIRRFEAEAHLIARLEHPHIVPLHDYWRDPEGAYLVMRWLPGNLRAALRHGPIPLDRIVVNLEQIAAALTAAHRQGIVHRDIKPDNILLDDDTNAYLADFGIAKDLKIKTDPERGLIYGAPAYLAPEQVDSGDVTPRTDIYSLGITLYELLTGKKPFEGEVGAAVLFKQLGERIPSISAMRPDLPTALDAVLQRATAKSPDLRYSDTTSMSTAFRRVIAPLLSSTDDIDLFSAFSPNAPTVPLHRSSTSRISTAIVDNPYKGLRAFQEADAIDFFGRDRLVERLLSRLEEDLPSNRMLAVIGPSGSGKSSAVRAGLIPALRRGGVKGSESWLIVQMTPGANPMDELQPTLLKVATFLDPELTTTLRKNTRGLLDVLNDILAAGTQLLLFIDQFEEVFTLCQDEEERSFFLNSLIAAVSDPRSRIRIVLTLRADFYDRPLLYHDFGELLRQRTEVVLPLSPDELERAIVGPAERIGVALEPGLVAAIVQDVNEQPGTLPLLQYALTELFEHRKGMLLTLEAYEASGGVSGALARRADDLYNELSDEQQSAARQVMLRLVTLGEGAEDTGRRVRRAELVSMIGSATIIDAVIDTFARYRLMTLDRDPITREPTVEVAHEALIRTWTTLRQWLDHSREELRVQRRLMAEAADWQTARRDPSFLASGVRLMQYTTLADDGHVALTHDEDEYLESSTAKRDQEEAQARERQAAELKMAQIVATAQRAAANRLRYLVALLAVFLIIVGALAVYALDQRKQAVTNAEISAANLVRSEALRLAAEANTLLKSDGSAELAALLSIRSMNIQYSPQADTALDAAVTLDYPVQLYSGHTGAVNAVAVSPDSKTILTASTDGTARLWDTASGKQIGQFKGNGQAIYSAAFSPDGKTVLTCGADKVAHLWDATTGSEIRSFIGHSGDLQSVAFSPDGKTILTGSDDKTAILWDTATGQKMRQFIGHDNGIRHVAFSPDGKTILTGSDDETARLWDVADGQLIKTFDAESGPVYALAFSPDGKAILTGGGDRIAHLWDIASGADVRDFSGHTDYIESMAFSPDGRYVLTGSDDQTARLWNAATGDVVHTFHGNSGYVYDAEFSPDGRYVLTGSADGTARLWNTVFPNTFPDLNANAGVIWSVVFSPDSRYVLTGSDDNTARLWDVQTSREVMRFSGHTGYVGIVAFSPDGKTILTGSSDRTARLWDVATGKQIRQFVGHDDTVNGLAFSPDGKTILTASSDMTARLWDVATGQPIRVFSGHTSKVQSIAFSPDGKTILTGSADGTAILWDAATGQQLHVLKGHNSTVEVVKFSPDGTQALTGGDDKTARLWDVATGQQIRVFSGHTGIVWDVGFSRDGKTILTASADETARLWDVATGQEIRQLAGHTADVGTGAFSPDGKTVVTGSSDGTIRLWATDYHDEISAVCARLLRDFTDDERAQYAISDSQPTCPPVQHVPVDLAVQAVF